MSHRPRQSEFIVSCRTPYPCSSLAVCEAAAMSVLVKTDAGKHKGPLLIEYDEAVEKATGLHVQDAIFIPQDGVAQLVVSNPSGFTQVVGEGEKLGMVMEMTVVQPEEVEESGEVTGVRVVQPEVASDAHTFTVSVEQQQRRVMRQGDGGAHWYHRSGEIETTQATRRTQCRIQSGRWGVRRNRPGGDGDRHERCQAKAAIIRRMPFAVRQEVSRLLKSMQSMGVIQPSNSPWASPVDGTHRFCVNYRS